MAPVVGFAPENRTVDNCIDQGLLLLLEFTRAPYYIGKVLAVSSRPI